MERVGIVIADGVVANVILWTDATPDQLRADGYTQFEEVTNFAQRPGIGWLWDETHGYRPPQPYPSWSWNGVTWEAPASRPEGRYFWKEETLTWEELPPPEMPPEDLFL